MFSSPLPTLNLLFSLNPGGCAILVVCLDFSCLTVVVYSSMVDITGCNCGCYAESVLLLLVSWFGCRWYHFALIFIQITNYPICAILDSIQLYICNADTWHPRECAIKINVFFTVSSKE